MLNHGTFRTFQFLSFLFLLTVPLADLFAQLPDKSQAPVKARQSGNRQPQNNGVIKGSLIDENGGSLPFASIILKNISDLVIYKSTTSNNEGIFILSGLPYGVYVLEVSMVGFESLVKRNLTVDTSTISLNLGTLQLSPSAKMLRAVNINAQVPFIERQADKIVVNLNNSINAGSSIMEVMGRLPGVQVSPNDQITLNGRGVQIYIDGKLTPLSAEALTSLLKGMASEHIQKIELIAHPSSKYDAAGSGGIINIVRKRNHKEGISGNVYGGVGKGEYGKQNGGLNLNFKDETFNFLLNTNYSFNKYFVDSRLTSDFFNADQTLTGQSVAQINSIRSNRTVAPNLGVDIYLSKKATLSLSLAESAESFHKDAGSYTSDFDGGLTGTGSSYFLNLVKMKTNNFSSGMHLLYQIDTLGRELTVDADYFNYGNRMRQDNTNTLFNTQGGVYSQAQTFFDQDRDLNAYSAKADYTHPLRKGAKLEAGWKSSYVISDNSNQLFDRAEAPQLSAADKFRYTENINALYTTYSKKYQRFSYQLGLRAEHTHGNGEQVQTAEQFKKNSLKLFPSAFFDYKFNENHSLNITLNKRIERPGYENLNPLIRIINGNNYVQGNPALQPVVAYNASASYSYKNALSVAIYYTVNLHDFTTVSSIYGDEEIITTKPINNKNTQYFSYYLTYNKQITPWWYTSTQASLHQQSFQSTVNGYSFNSPGQLAFNFDNFDSFEVMKKLFIDVLYKYSGKSQERTVTTDANSYLTAGVRKVFKKASVSFNVTDLFNSFTNRYTQNSVLIRQLWDNHYETRIYRLKVTYDFGGSIKRTKNSTGADNEKSRTRIKEN